MSARKRDVSGKQPKRQPDTVSGAADVSKAKPSTNERGSCCRYCCFSFCGFLIAFAVVVYLLPSPIDPVAFNFSDTADGPPPPTGVFAPNNDLQKARRLFEGEVQGAESFVADKDGYIYTGLLDGRVIKINPKTETFDVLTRMGDPPYDECGKRENLPSYHCGRPEAMKINKDGNILLVDGYKGLFLVNIRSGEKKHLFKPEKTGELSCLFFNYLTLHSNGSVFITCSSWKFPVHDYMLDALQGRAEGKVFHYNPTNGRTSVLKQDLYSPNGMALSSGEDFLLVSEITRAKIIKYHLKGPKVGTWEIFIDNLPAFVDNITPTKDGSAFWAGGLMVRYGTMMDFITDKPWIRNIAAKLRLMSMIEQTTPLYTMVLVISEEGSVIKTLQDQTGKAVYRVTEGFEFEGDLYLGSHIAPFIGKLKL